MKLAIMQPYFFPFIGYWQLIHAVDIFVIYDDVSYIKRGWINRNRILLNNEPYLFSISCKKSSQNKLINEIELALDSRLQNKLFKTFEHAYIKAPFYKEIACFLKELFGYKDDNLSNFLTNLIQQICYYLNISTTILKSSDKYHCNKGMDKADRLIDITKNEGADYYINPIGGQSLYDKQYFFKKGICLSYLVPNIVKYRQFSDKFTPNLSIIDVLMFNSKKDVFKMLNDYSLI